MNDSPNPADPAHDPGDTDRLPRALGVSAWTLYALIVLEILFMISPFAAYYYAAYALPLNALADAPRTAWLTLQVLPHFSWSDSVLVRVLIGVAWPLILGGLVLFCIAFVQIYRARFTGRGAVTGGLYRYVRHPQYLALAVVGLGTTLYWSRYVVIAAYTTMLLLYGLLARLEERRCLAQFGAPYAAYLARTGRFLPRTLEQGWRRLRGNRATPVAARGRGWSAVGLLVTLATLAATLGLATLLRQHALGSLQVEVAGPHTALFLAPLEQDVRYRAFASVAGGLGDTPRLVYFAPAHWSVPELGLVGDAAIAPDNLRELRSPTTHGNTGGFDPAGIRVLITRPQVHTAAPAGRTLLARTVRVEPVALFTLDLTRGVTTPGPAPGPGHWRGIPVPAF